MKKKSRLTLKQLLFMAALLFIFTILTLFLFRYRRDEKRFCNVTSHLFTQEMLADTLNMHYTLAHPENFGISGYSPKLSCYHAELTERNKSDLSQILSELKDIQPDRLSPPDARLYKLLTRYLENNYQLSQYPYYRDPLSPSSGMQSQLPILLAEYTFRSKQDVIDYLHLLDQTDEYFAGLLNYEKDKISSGIPIPVTTLKSTRKQCDTIVTSTSLSEQSHFLQSSFQERVLTLADNDVITLEEARQYMARNDRLLKTVMYPAYTALGDGLLLLEDETAPLTGLAVTKEGKAYYSYLLISQTGSYREANEIRKLLTDQFTSEYEQLQKLLSDNPEAAKRYAEGMTCNLPAMSEAEILQDLQRRMSGSFPELPGSPTITTIKPVSQNMETYCAPAFYLTAPIDDTSKNVIYINHRKTLSGLELYTTLAHEGYPGHLYQTVYSNRQALAGKEKPVRQLLWYGGYLEGWALYCEFLSYDYVTDLFTEQNNSTDAVLARIEKHNRSLQLCLYSLLDLMIHSENIPFNQVADILGNLGITDQKTIKSIYTYIVQEPCNYLKYYLGYMEILKLKEKAVQLWQTDYSDYRFHSFLLDYGPADFLSLDEFLTEYTHSSIMLSK